MFTITIDLMLDLLYAYAVFGLVQGVIRALVRERVEVANGGEPYSSMPYVFLLLLSVIKMALIAFVVTPLCYRYLDPHLLETTTSFFIILITASLLLVIEFISLQILTLIKTGIIMYMVHRTKKKHRKG